MDPRTFEVTVLSAEDLRVDKKPVKKNAFVVVKTDALTKRSTKADCHGGSFPSWNEKLAVPMPTGCRSLTLEVQCRTGRGGDHDRVVGSASVPVSDFLGGWAPEGYLHFLSYRLRDSLGRKNGIINISVRVGGGGGGGGGYASCGKSYGECCSSLSSSVTGWRTMPVAVGVPAAGREHGVSMGIPVWGA